ncbi:MAG: hypothetical protein KGL39_31110 [Patescibacteria group bacterium]|nr:hypothetical protein [Patescibacteria group bacterium]
MKPYVITFGPWLPDGADLAFGMPFQYRDTPVPLADCQNVYYAQGAYRSLPSLVSSGALASKCLGAVTGLDTTGTPQIYAAAGADLYHRSGSSWTSVSKSAGAYSGATGWSFAAFGGCIYAADGIHAMQDLTIGGSAFADVTAAPIGSVLGVIGQFLFVGNITSPTAYPYRVQWSAIGDPNTWPTPLTDAAVADQSGYEDLSQDFGAVQFIGGGPRQGTILQRLGLTRATYVGGDTVFDFVPFERKKGLITPGAAVQVGDVTHYIADDGFHMTDGSQVVATGTSQSAALDKWFWNNVNQSALSVIRAGWDADKKCVAYAIPTGSNTLPDTVLLLNPSSGNWTKGALSSEFLFTDNDGTRHRLGVFSQTHQLGYLTGTAASGYCESYDMSFVDGMTRRVSEAQPHIICTDSPTMRVGTKMNADAAPTYTADNARNAFSQRVSFDPPPAGLFVRARVTSAAASAISGATVYTEMDGAR